MEELALYVTKIVSHSLELLAAAVIGLAVIKSFAISFPGMAKPNGSLTIKKTFPRLEFGRAIGLALELMLAADVLATAVAPSWNDIGQLAAIATIRTVLNYFLEQDLENNKQD
jgi:uncharacterized membrane protein